MPRKRAKNNRPNIVPLAATAKWLLAAMPEYGDYVFGLAGRVPFSGFRKGKAELDRQMKLTLAEKWKPWVAHDLRRTARSLMSRAGVRPEIGERVLNHVIAGVQGVYDRHDYAAEKRAALEALDLLVNRIVDPSYNVVELAPTGRPPRPMSCRKA